ncbi:hypothetical protein [Mesorhizobium sp. LjNodule214]|uniref:hypothetical protein n=1 Tax=Mesorhizobium sp. LjNodule214 TaxID=3342252 RepID=UPI003ECD4653
MEACRSFVVVPPHGAKFDNLSLQMRIEEELMVEFAGFKFVVTTFGPGRYEDFSLIPILGTANDPAGASLAAIPDFQVFSAIAFFLARYIDEERPRLN